MTDKREALAFLRNRSAPEVTLAGRDRQLEATSVADGRDAFLPPWGVHCAAAHGY
jgi:hypothetical protein